ncbi:MAG: hypothetical protein ACKVIQ_19175 [Acidimicrobiales bacterium]
MGPDRDIDDLPTGHGWVVPSSSAVGSDFNDVMGATVDGAEPEGPSVLLGNNQELYFA